MSKQASNAVEGTIVPLERSGGKLTVAQMDANDVLSQVAVIRDIMAKAMQDGMHYGKIPGTDKPTLLLPGAQKLGMTFRFCVSYPKVERVELSGGHREFFVTARIEDSGGKFMGEGLGSCSTMESKYRFRKTSAFEPTEHTVPQSYWKLKDKKDKARCLMQIMDDASSSFGVKKIPDDASGVWFIVRYTGEGDKEEYPNPADYYNTVLKIGKKRAFVDAILTVTAAGDIFTQDLEDLTANREALQEETGRVWPEAGSSGADTQRAEQKPEPKQESKAEKPDKPQSKGKEKKSAALDNSPSYNGPADWRENIVHFDSTLVDRKLGTLTKAELELIREKWVNDPRFWGQPFKGKDGTTSVTITPTTQDEFLKAKVLEGIAELSKPAPEPEAVEFNALKYVTAIQDELAERGIRETEYFAILRDNNQLPDGVDWKSLDDVDSEEWLAYAAGSISALDVLMKVSEQRAKLTKSAAAASETAEGDNPAPTEEKVQGEATERSAGYAKAPAKPVRRKAAKKGGK